MLSSCALILLSSIAILSFVCFRIVHLIVMNTLVSTSCELVCAS